MLSILCTTIVCVVPTVYWCVDMKLCLHGLVYLGWIMDYEPFLIFLLYLYMYLLCDNKRFWTFWTLKTRLKIALLKLNPDLPEANELKRALTVHHWVSADEAYFYCQGNGVLSCLDLLNDMLSMFIMLGQIWVYFCSKVLLEKLNLYVICSIDDDEI